MPTSAKIVSALLMAGLGYWVAHLVIDHLPPETPIGWFREITAIIGFLVGWSFLGRRAVEGFMPGITFGVGASAFLVFWALVVFALDEMIDRAFRKSYGNPMEAIQGMIEIGIEFFQYVTPLQVASTLIGGGAVIGVIAYLVSRRWS